MKNALELLKEFCTYDFVERNCEKALALLTEDICWFGTSDQEDVHGLPAARLYVRNEIQDMPSPYRIRIFDEACVPTSADSSVAFFRMTMECEGIRVALRVTAASRTADGASKLCTMHFSVADGNQQPDEFYPLAKGREKIANVKRELVLSTMPGGLMGAYVKPGYPLYFIDDRLLQYLGYASEAEFSADVDGLISHAIHPLDRAAVDQAVHQSERYTVDYRLRRRDGSYIWVRDVGRTSTSEDGRAVLLSVCYDITEEHQKQVQLDNMINALPVGVALYRLENGDCKVLYQSQGLAKIVGMTQDEYKNLVEARVTGAIYARDADKVLQALEKTSHSDETVSVDFRVEHVSGHTVWINGCYKRTAIENGCPIIHAVFSEMSQMRELLTNVVDNSGVAIVVSDDHTRELLYVNKEALAIYHKTDLHYESKLCYQYLRGRDKPCSFCRNRAGKPFNSQPCEIYEPDSGRYFMTQGRIVNWAGREAHIEYLTDITETKMAQQQLSEVSQEMQTIVDNIPGGVVKMRVVGSTILPIYLSDQFCEMMDDTRENLMTVYQNNSMAGVHPDDLAYVLQVVAEGVSGGESFCVTYRICNSRGEYHWVNNRASRVTDQNGQVFYYAIYTNMDKEILASQAAEQAAKEMRLLYNSIPGAVFKCRFNADWDVIFANDGLFRFLGYTREEFETLFHNKMSGVIYPEDGAIMVDKISAQLAHGTTVQNENRLICKDGSIKWVSIHAELLTDEAGEKYFYCTFVDITEQKTAELALSQTQEKLSAAISHAGLAYWEYDVFGRKAYLNKNSTTEYRLPDVMENYPQSLYDSGTILPESMEAYQQLIDAVNAGKPTAVADIHTLNAQGEAVWKRMRFTTLFNERKQPFWAVATAEAIDEMKSLEQQFAITAVQTGIESWIYDVVNHTIVRTASIHRDHHVDAEISNVPKSLIEKGIIHKDDADVIYDLCRRIENGEKNVSAKVRMLHADLGEYAYHQIHYTVLFDKSGKPVKAIGTGVDISKQMDLEKQYLAALETYHNVPKENVLLSGYANITHNRLLGMTSQDNVDYLPMFKGDRNAFFVSLSGAVQEADKKQEVLDRFSSESAAAAFAKGITQQTIQCTILIGQRYYKHVKLSLEVLKKPGTDELTGFFNMTDVTDDIIFRKTVDIALKSNCDFIVDVDVNLDTYRMLVVPTCTDNLPQPSGKFSEANARYAKLLANAESTQACLEKLAIPYALKALETQSRYGFNYQVNESGVLRTKITQVFYIDKALGHIGFIRTDVTETLSEEQKKNEALAHALTSSEQANKAKTDFLSRMSHDIRTPMNAIIGMTELTKQEIDDKRKALENLGVIDSSAQLLLRIINDVLDMSQIESGNMVLAEETFDCQKECRNVMEMAGVMFAQKKQKFITEKCMQHQLFVGDAVRLKRVLMNLLQNASKFSPCGGEIRLTVREEKNLNPLLSTLVFAVSDSGIGIPKEKFDTIFRPFEQLETESKYLGTGLGLPIVKSIVEAKGGTISVDSEVGKGSTFTLHIPMLIAEKTALLPSQSAKAAASAAASVDFSPLRVLLVEDHPVNTMVAKRLLEKAGAVVDTAENGAMGYDKFIQSAPHAYNIIFMDIQMPVMNGYEAAKAIRESNHPQAKTIPIFAMTANAFTQDIQNSLDCGMNGHIAKPISVEAIARAIQAASEGLL